ncbi:asparagine synthase-related protein [Christiangramia forsetii]|uniref:Asparagine synthetase domain-containing protein n=2 Tax=Christiangramia forsetii TaxID=411153 RepID=A0M2X7_CHRFK|nr:asparagine synthase-related protein [Christiangramia forsetii]GGG27286.1 hypothetical protein GCM10011532_08390 [Christiangramia forsetii]CAL66972.1 hypothetical protein GFO_2007 [Christiangramia forsetii KT0803]
MSKILYITYRNKEIPHDSSEKVKQITSELNPDNIHANPSYCSQNGRTICSLSNPLSVIKTEGTNVLLGNILNKEKNWTNPLKYFPDGNYAIFRSNNELTEVFTDKLSSRTIWYYYDDEILICATSQRAIIKFLSNFEFDERVIPWIISTGSLGPLYSWDSRIKRIPPATSLILKISDWKLELQPVNYDLGENLKSMDLSEKIYNAVDNQNLDSNKWALSLSGGYDSRLILLLLNKFKSKKEKIRTITWGIKNTEEEKGSDANIAKNLALNYQTDHSFFSTKISHEPIDLLLERFLKNGEGRIDHISSYMNGFDIWKYLFENNYEGILRGNQLFSGLKPASELDIRRFMGLSLISDFENLKKLNFLNSLEQFIPEELERKTAENLHQYRDRILADYRIPIIQAALSDLKFPYVEQYDPLLANSIVEEIRNYPDKFRNEKKIIKKILISLGNQEEFAKVGATRPKEELFKQENMTEEILKELNSKDAENIFPVTFLNEVITTLKKPTTSQSKTPKQWIKKYLSKALPLRIKKMLSKAFQASTLDISTLGFRLMVIIKMIRILQEDSVRNKSH